MLHELVIWEHPPEFGGDQSEEGWLYAMVCCVLLSSMCDRFE